MTVPTLNYAPPRADMVGVWAGDEILARINLVWIDDTGATVPFDLTGKTPRSQVRTKTTDDVHFIEAIIEVLDAPGGQLLLRWAGGDVRTLMAGKATYKGVYDLQLGSNGSDPKTVVWGQFQAQMDVTRDVTP